MEGEKMDSHKKNFEDAIFFSSQNIDFSFLFEETLGAFLFLSSPFSFFSLFSNTFSLSPFFQCSVSLRTWGFR
jgi:hypothetical protein